MEFLVFSKEQYLEIKSNLAELKSELGRIASNLSDANPNSPLSCEGKTLLTVEDIEKLLGISKSAIYRNKHLKSFRIGKRRYYHEKDLLEYLRAKKENAQPLNMKAIDKMLAASVSKKYRVSGTKK
jgi:predicted DNA-binding transcriptional regulator AlpA